MCFGDTKVTGPMQPREPFDGAKALLDAEPQFRDHLVEPFFRSTRRAITHRLSHDPITVFAAQGRSVSLSGICLVGQHPLCACAFDHRCKLRALGWVGGCGVYLIHGPFLIGARKAFKTQRALCTLFYPMGIRIVATAVQPDRDVWFPAIRETRSMTASSAQSFSTLEKHCGPTTLPDTNAVRQCDPTVLP